MATGDAAVAAGMDVMTGSEAANTLDTEMNKTRDYIANRTYTTLPLNKGGTAATTAAAGRTNLGITAANTPSTGATGSNVQDAIEFLDSVKISNASAGTNTITIRHDGGGFLAYTVDGTDQGRLAKVAVSSERYKEQIEAVDPAVVGDVWPEFVRYRMRNASDAEPVWRYGYIVEQMVQEPAQAEFVVWREIDGVSVPDSYDEAGLLRAQNVYLKEMVECLGRRVTALEG